MSTRFATVADIPAVVQLLMQFAQEAEVGFRSATAKDTQRVYNLVNNWIHCHYVRVACVADQVVAVLVAERGQDFWDPERSLLQERAWYVVPQYRGTRLSARLWQAWQQDSTVYVERKQVQAVLMSTQGAKTEFDPGRRGWRLIEQTWIKE